MKPPFPSGVEFVGHPFSGLVIIGLEPSRGQEAQVMAANLLAEQRQSTTALRGRVVSTSALDRALQERLFELFSRYYLHVDRSQFDRDQGEKDWVLLLSDIRAEVQGFTTLKHYEIEVQGRLLQVVFSRNTI